MIFPSSPVLELDHPLVDGISSRGASARGSITMTKTVGPATQSIEFETGEFDDTNQMQAESERHKSELRFRDLLDAMPAAAYLCDTNGLITYYNRQAVKVWGRAPKLNDPVDRFCGSFKLLSAQGERIRHDQCWMAVALQQLRPVKAEEIIVERPDGSRRTVMADVNLLRNESGELLGAVNVLTDITERKQAEVAMARLAAIVESSDDAIIGKNISGIIQSWNRGAERIFGYTAQEVIGKSITLLIPPDRVDEEPEILRRIRRGEHIDHYESVRRRKDGRLLDVSLTISPISNARGQIVGASKIARDITGHKEREAALMQSEKLIAIGRLASNMAHEINNPLEAVTNLIWLLRSDASLPPHAQEYLKIADEELSRVAHLARMTLSFHRSNATPQRICPGELVEDVLAIFASRLRNKNIRVNKKIDLRCRIMAVDGELRQVVTNLINNSIDAVDHGGSIRIRVASVHDKGRSGVRIAVTDGGPGIPFANRSRIFEPFFSTKPDTGTGIGLSVTKEIIEKHNGSIRLRSSTRPGQSWTAFSVFLPDLAEAASRSASESRAIGENGFASRSGKGVNGSKGRQVAVAVSRFGREEKNTARTGPEATQ
jgi:PAS domain S-box-containing protein